MAPASAASTIADRAARRDLDALGRNRQVRNISGRAAWPLHVTSSRRMT